MSRDARDVRESIAWQEDATPAMLPPVSAPVPPAPAVPLPAAPHDGPLDLSKALLSFSELQALILPERRCLLPWLFEGGNAMIYGPRGAGKTMFGLGIATALTAGTAFLSWPIAQAVEVLYVDGEMQLDDLRARVLALAPSLDKPLHFLTNEWLYHTLEQDLVLTGDAMRESLTRLLEAHPTIRVVIFDNISCLFSGIDEDKKRDWEPINAWLIRLRHRGISSILIHHAGKGGQQRGTSGREDALDTVIHLDRPHDYDSREGCHFKLAFTKCRSVKGDAVGSLDVWLIGDPGRLAWASTPLERSNEDKVRALLQEGITRLEDLAEAAGISRTQAFRLKRKIEQEGGGN